MELFRTIFLFTALIGPLVIIHELGHFIAARYFGVKVYQFAIGFGPRIFSWHTGKTEITWGLLPLGGFVRMANAPDDFDTLEDGSEVYPEAGESLSEKPIWQRAIVFLAGPAMNLILPIFIFFALSMTISDVTPAVMGTIEPGLPASMAGLETGDRIISIDGRKTISYSEFQEKISKSAGKALVVEYERNGELRKTTVTPEVVTSRHPIFPQRLEHKGKVGVTLQQYGPTIHVAKDSPVAQAGLKTFDTIMAIDGREIPHWNDIYRVLESPGTHSVTFLRPVRTKDPWSDVRIRLPHTIELAPGSKEELGLTPAENVVWTITPGSPADKAGLQMGDRLLEVDGKSHAGLYWFLSDLQVGANKEHTLLVERDGEKLQLKITPEQRAVTAEFRSKKEAIFIGFRGYSSVVNPDRVPIGFWDKTLRSVRYALLDTLDNALMLVGAVAMIFTGELGSDQLGGPMMIADVASQAARSGLDYFIGTMAMMSINLGIFNLIPIPGLDGGHLAVLGLEGINRGPLPPRMRQAIHFIGVVSVILLMLFVFKNDIERYWESLANWINT